MSEARKVAISVRIHIISLVPTWINGKSFPNNFGQKNFYSLKHYVNRGTLNGDKLLSKCRLNRITANQICYQNFTGSFAFP